MNIKSAVFNRPVSHNSEFGSTLPKTANRNAGNAELLNGTAGNAADQRFNIFRSNIQILNHPDIRALMDYLEFTENNKVNPANGRFGTNGIRMLKDLDVDDPRWENNDRIAVNARHFVNRDLRHLVKKAAGQIWNSWDLLKPICGDDAIFEPRDMDLWLRNNPPKRIDDNNTIQYRDFRNAMMVLFEDEALDMMDYLESLDGKGQSGNRRFGMLGMNRLSRLTAESPHWDKVGGGHLTKQVRQDMINAAKTALDSNKAHILLGVHGGDGIFERGDIREWVERNNSKPWNPESMSAYEAKHTRGALDAIKNKAVLGLRIDMVDLVRDPDGGLSETSKRDVNKLLEYLTDKHKIEFQGTVTPQDSDGKLILRVYSGNEDEVWYTPYRGTIYAAHTHMRVSSLPKPSDRDLKHEIKGAEDAVVPCDGTTGNETGKYIPYGDKPFG